MANQGFRGLYNEFKASLAIQQDCLQIKRIKAGVWLSVSDGAHLIIGSATVSSKAGTLLSTHQPLTRPFVTPLPYQHSLANYPVDFGHYPGCEGCLVLWAVVSLPPWPLYRVAVLPLMKSSWFPLGSLYFLYFPRRLAEVTKTYCCFFWEFIVHCWFYIEVCLWSVLS